MAAPCYTSVVNSGFRDSSLAIAKAGPAHADRQSTHGTDRGAGRTGRTHRARPGPETGDGASDRRGLRRLGQGFVRAVHAARALGLRLRIFDLEARICLPRASASESVRMASLVLHEAGALSRHPG